VPERHHGGSACHDGVPEAPLPAARVRSLGEISGVPREVRCKGVLQISEALAFPDMGLLTKYQIEPIYHRAL
jgi:hypothetical protein